MSCQKHFLNLQWTHHHWRPQVTGSETLTFQEPDMWARPVFRDYVRCDKRQVCETCGEVRRERSCLCEVANAEKCMIYREWRARSAQLGSKG